VGIWVLVLNVKKANVGQSYDKIKERLQ
jgi:hypothetical protein